MKNFGHRLKKLEEKRNSKGMVLIVRHNNPILKKENNMTVIRRVNRRRDLQLCN